MRMKRSMTKKRRKKMMNVPERNHVTVASFWMKLVWTVTQAKATPYAYHLVVIHLRPFDSFKQLFQMWMMSMKTRKRTPGRKEQRTFWRRV